MSRGLSLHDVLASMGGNDDSDNHRSAPDPLPEAQIMRLRDFAERYGKNPFKVGDLVRPRAESALRGHKKPHLVVDVHEREFNFSGESGSNSYGIAADIRVAHLEKDCVLVHWCEAHEFEFYTEPLS